MGSVSRFDLGQVSYEVAEHPRIAVETVIRHYYFHQPVEVGPLRVIKLSADQGLQLFVRVERTQTLNRENLAEALFEELYLKIYCLVENVVQTQIDVVLQVFQSYFLLLAALN